MLKALYIVVKFLILSRYGRKLLMSAVRGGLLRRL